MQQQLNSAMQCVHHEGLVAALLPVISTRHPTGLPTACQSTFLPSQQVLVIEGLHPFYDERVRDLVDFKIYLDISDDVKFAWKIQRDMAERGHSLDSIKKSIEARKPDFDAYIDPQKKNADMIIQVLPTQLVPEDEGKILRVRLIQKEGKKLFDPVYLFDEGSTISWIPCGRKLTCSFPGIKFYYGPDTWCVATVLPLLQPDLVLSLLCLAFATLCLVSVQYPSQSLLLPHCLFCSQRTSLPASLSASLICFCLTSLNPSIHLCVLQVRRGCVRAGDGWPV